MLLTLLPAAPLWGGEFQFNDLSFGDPPLPAMICTSGACLPRSNAPAQLPIASYAFSRDWTHFSQVPITSPRYDFLNGQLFRIRFRLDCRTGECLQTFWNEFMSSHPVTESPCQTQSVAFECRRGAMGGGDVLSLTWQPHHGSDDRPKVQIFEPILMDEARHLANPGYPYHE